MPADHPLGLVDTDIVILRDWISGEDLPPQLAISAVTLAELSAGPHSVVGDDAEARTERARRVAILQRAESEFDPLPFDTQAARLYGQLVGAVIAHGRTPRRRVADLQIAAIAAAQGLPLYTTNPDDFDGLHALVTIVPVRRPALGP